MTSRGQPNKRVIWREVQISRVLATIALQIRLVDQLRSMIPMKETLDLVSDPISSSQRSIQMKKFPHQILLIAMLNGLGTMTGKGCLRNLERGKELKISINYETKLSLFLLHLSLIHYEY